MTAPDIALLVKGWNLIAEGAATVALAYGAAEQPGRGVPSPAPAPDDDLPPMEEEGPDQFLAQVVEKTGGTEVRADTALGRCPDHGVAWKVVPAGVSKKTGKEYDAFYACPEKGCNEKPIRVWRDSHPIGWAA